MRGGQKCTAWDIECMKPSKGKTDRGNALASSSRGMKRRHVRHRSNETNMAHYNSHSSCGYDLWCLFFIRFAILHLCAHLPVLILRYRVVFDGALCICANRKAFHQARGVCAYKIGNRIPRSSQPSRAFVTIRERWQRHTMQSGLEIV